jgi:hypothetical protein
MKREADMRRFFLSGNRCAGLGDHRTMSALPYQQAGNYRDRAGMKQQDRKTQAKERISVA